MTSFVSAAGAVAPNGSGMVTITAIGRDGGPCGAPYESEFSLIRNFWIDGDELVMCRGNMSGPGVCDEPAPRVVATFGRSG